MTKPWGGQLLSPTLLHGARRQFAEEPTAISLKLPDAHGVDPWISRFPSLTSNFSEGFVVPTPTLAVFVLEILLPLVVHCCPQATEQLTSVTILMQSSRITLTPGMFPCAFIIFPLM